MILIHPDRTPLAAGTASLHPLTPVQIKAEGWKWAELPRRAGPG